jgi:hypothetical protein
MARQCPVCGSDHLIPGVDLRDRHGQYPSIQHEVELIAHPTHLINRGGITSPVQATVCGSCGYVMLFANFPADLWRVYREAQGEKD